MENHSKFESAKNSLNEKRKIWDEKMAQMLKPDVYGYVLDEKIRETIVALNLLGINTTQSDQGNYADTPWIEFQALEPKSYYVGENELRASVLECKNLQPEVMDQSSPLFDRSIQVDVWTESRDELMKNGAEYTTEFLKYHNETQKMVQKLQALIDEYYSQNPDLQGRNMKVEINYPYNDNQHPAYLHQLPHLEISVLKPSESEEERKIFVAQTQAKMLKFTEYLKNKFFENK